MKAYAMIADGTEETECLTVVDLLRRAGADVTLVSADALTVKTSHGVLITADETLDNADLSDGDLIFVPGGLAGSKRLGGCKKLIAALEAAKNEGRRIAAVCAAPALVFGANGLLYGKRAVCFPGFEESMKGAELQPGARVVTDGNVTTARGLGCCVDLGLELIRLTVGEGAAAEIKNKIQY